MRRACRGALLPLDPRSTARPHGCFRRGGVRQARRPIPLWVGPREQAPPALLGIVVAGCGLVSDNGTGARNREAEDTEGVFVPSHHSPEVRKLIGVGALLALLVCVVVSGYRYRARPPAGRESASGIETKVSELWRTVATGSLMEVRRAERELEQLARTSVDLQLVDRLSHENWRVRAVAVSVIRTCGMTQYIPCLICRLSDVNRRVRCAAALTLEAVSYTHLRAHET